MLEAKGTANRHHPFAGLQRGRITEFNGWQAIRLNFEQCHISAFVGTHDLCTKLSFIKQLHRDFVSALNDMGVGHDVTVCTNDEARTQGAILRLLRLHTAGRLREETSEDFKSRVVGVGRKTIGRFTATILHGADINDRGRLFFC